MNLVPYYWRNDYAGIEQYSATTENGQTLVDRQVRREHKPLPHIWDNNLKAQGFLEPSSDSRRAIPKDDVTQDSLRCRHSPGIFLPSPNFRGALCRAPRAPLAAAKIN